MFNFRHHNRVHRENRTTANSIATINSVATGEIQTPEPGEVFEATNSQVCDLRLFILLIENFVK